MSETTQDVYMQWQRSYGMANSSIFLAVGLAKGVINLIHFLAKMREEKILSGGEVNDFADFLKATKGKYEISRVPLKADGDIAEEMSAFKEDLNTMNIRYCMLPNLAGNEKSCYVAVFKDDDQKFAQVFMSHIKNALSGGKQVEEDIKNFTDGRASIFSIPDETVNDMEKAMTDLHVNFSGLQIDITPFHRHYLVPNNELNKIQFLYKAYQEDLRRGGKDVGDSKVYKDENEFKDATKRTEDDYIKDQEKNPSVKSAMEKGDHPLTEKEAELYKAMNEIGSSESLPCGKFYQNTDYLSVSIDDATLVHNPKDKKIIDFALSHPDVFCCRVPGTYGEKEEILVLPRDQVFKVDDADRERYVAFLKKDETPTVIGAKQGQYKNAESLYQHFSKQGKRLSYDPESLSEVRSEDLKAGWESLKGKPSPNMAGDPFPGMRSKRGFYERTYTAEQWDQLEKRLLGVGDAVPKVPDVPEVPVIPVGVPTKVL